MVGAGPRKVLKAVGCFGAERCLDIHRCSSGAQPKGPKQRGPVPQPQAKPETCQMHKQRSADVLAITILVEGALYKYHESSSSANTTVARRTSPGPGTLPRTCLLNS